MAAPLIKVGHQVTLLLEDSEDNRLKVAQECPEANVVYHQRYASALQERRQKQETVKQLAPDCVWICAVGARTWVRRPHSKCIMLADHSELPSAFVKKPVRKFYEYLCEWGHIFAFDGHICASRYLERFYAKRMQRVGKPAKAHHSPYAYNRLLLQTEPVILEDLQSRYTGKKTIVYMGGFWENYGFWDMLHSFQNLARSRSDLQMLMLGKGPEKEAGAQWIRDQGLEDRIHLVGYAPEEHLSSYFSFADLFICPLRNTIQDIARCPSKLYMYLAFKKPIVTCRIGEAEQVFGDNGYYYEPGNRAALQSALLDVLENADMNRLPGLELHDWEARTASFLEWFAAEFPQID
jgi:glycosyltransferase involved in cell wall biosynthesis